VSVAGTVNMEPGGESGRQPINLHGQTKGSRPSSLRGAQEPRRRHGAGLPGTYAAPPAGVLGDGIVPTPAAARCSSGARP